MFLQSNFPLSNCINLIGPSGAKFSGEGLLYFESSKKYTNLWSNLDEIRKNSTNNTFYYTSPDRLDPFKSFSNYPTNMISDDKIISLKNKNIDQVKQEIKDLKKLFLI